MPNEAPDLTDVADDLYPVTGLSHDAGTRRVAIDTPRWERV